MSFYHSYIAPDLPIEPLKKMKRASHQEIELCLAEHVSYWLMRVRIAQTEREIELAQAILSTYVNLRRELYGY